MLYGVDDQADVAIAKASPGLFATREAVMQEFTIEIGKGHG